MMNKDYILLIDSQPENLSILDDIDKEFLYKKKLIEISDNVFISKFVGEVITPVNKYFSLPKNFNKDISNIDVIKNLIKKYKELRDDTGKLVLTNNVFSIKNDGDIRSEKVYFNNLKDFFLDYITYEFIYPKKRKTIHTEQIVKGGKIDILKTIKNRKQFGIGTTYKVKDVENNKNWNLDDIYYYTLNELLEEYGTEKDKKDIYDMKKYLISEGYIIRDLKYDKSNEEEFYKKILKDIEKCDVGIIHQPIKNNLLNYYKFKKIGEFYILNLFYTKRFEYVWEYTIRIVLKDDINIRNSLGVSFNRIRRFNPDKGTYEILEEEKKLIPDIISNYNNKIFIGDAKYYKNINDGFIKEKYEYNRKFNSLYPVVVLVPYNSRTISYQTDEPGDEYELIIIKLSIKEVLDDLFENTNWSILRVQELIAKNSSRW